MYGNHQEFEIHPSRNSGNPGQSKSRMPDYFRHEELPEVPSWQILTG
jgi:hypothetical protein